MTTPPRARKKSSVDSPANLSVVEDDDTARTDPDCARQRAEYLAVLGARSVLELCVGPSLRVLEEAYGRVGIRAVGNDLDPRWRSYYPRGAWVLGDALSVDPSPYDAVVFAPPLTRGCTGRRRDALSVDEVRPAYRDFLQATRGFRGIRVLVLPARALATRRDRGQYHGLLASLGAPHEVMPLRAGRRGVRKYVDVYVLSRPEDPAGDARRS